MVHSKLMQAASSLDGKGAGEHAGWVGGGRAAVGDPLEGYGHSRQMSHWMETIAEYILYYIILYDTIPYHTI